MSNEAKFLWLLFVAVGINRLCAVPPAYHYFDPFLLYDILDKDGNNVGISYQSYAYAALNHISAVLFLWAPHFILKRDDIKILLYNFRCIEFVSILDFGIRYEHPWFYIGNYGVEFTDAKIILWFIYIVRWKIGKKYS